VRATPISRILFAFIFGLASERVCGAEFELLATKPASIALAWTTQADEGLYSLAWSPNSELLACGGLGAISMFAVPGFTALDPLEGDQGEIWGLDWSPNSDLLVSGGINGSLFWWEHRVLQKSRQQGAAVYDLAFSPNGRELAVADVSSSVKIWNVEGYATSTIQLDGAGLGVSWAPNQRELAIGTGQGGSSLLVLNTGTAEIRWRKQNVPSNYRAPYGFGKDEVNGVAYSPRGNWIAAALQDGRVVVLGSKTGGHHMSLQLHRPGNGGARRVSWSPNGKWLASCGEDGRVNLVSFSQPTRRIELLSTTKPVWAVAFSPNGKWLAAVGDEGRVWVWNMP
jgi:WD40 repeat protein